MSEESKSLPCEDVEQRASCVAGRQSSCDTSYQPVSGDNSDSIEKPTTKMKKPYKWTEARKAAFERCRKARSSQIKDIRKKKIIDAGLVPVEQPEATKPVETPKAPDAASEQPQKKTKPRKKVIVYQSESSSESSSESDIEVEIRRKPRQKRVKAYSPERSQPVASPVNPYQQILTWL